MSTNAGRFFVLGALTLCFGTGCDEVEWQGPEYVDSLRVLGVRAEPPTLTRGASAQLSMICADGRRGAGEDPTCNAEVAWFAQCNNPDQNDPDHCFTRYAKWADRMAPSVSQTSTRDYPDGFGFGPSLEFSPPEEILSQELELAGDIVRYGTSYVFFAVCAGELVPVRGVEERLPVECRDRKTGEKLDHRSFVVGVTTLYTYDRVTSQNPVLLTPRFDSVKVHEACASADECPAGFDCSAERRCVPVVQRCKERDSDNCEEHCLRFDLDLDSFSLFSVDGARLDAPRESLWLDYFTNAGSLPDDNGGFALRAPAGAANQKRTPCIRWQAPREPTEHAHLWAVVRDNRGGVTAYDQRIIVR